MYRTILIRECQYWIYNITGQNWQIGSKMLKAQNCQMVQSVTKLEISHTVKGYIPNKLSLLFIQLNPPIGSSFGLGKTSSNDIEENINF
jgi:hypothetical protein